MRFNNPIKNEEPGISAPSKICGVDKCNNDATFAVMKAQKGSQALHKSCSDVADVTYNDGRPHITMKPSHHFLGWFVRCDKCLGENIMNTRANLTLQGCDKNYC